MIPCARTLGMIEGNPMVGKDEKQKIIMFNNLFNCLLRDEQASSVPCTHPNYGSSVNIMVTWKNREITPKSPTIVAADDPVTCAIYAYGTTIPRSYQHTISLVRNSNTKWFDGIAVVSLAQVNVHPTYEDFGNAFTVGPPKDGRRQQVRRVCDHAFVSLHGVLTTTELNGSTTLSMDDLATPKHDTQLATVPDIRTTPS